MVLEVLDRGRPRRLVALGHERQPVARPGHAVSLRPERRARLDEREIDVEEDRFDFGTRVKTKPVSRAALAGTMRRPRLRP